MIVTVGENVPFFSKGEERLALSTGWNSLLRTETVFLP